VSALGMFGRVAQGYLSSAEADRDKKAQKTKEQEQFASSILLKLVDNPPTPEAGRWAQQTLLEIAEGKWKGKLDISQIPTGEPSPGKPPELGKPPEQQFRQMPTPPPPTGEQYLTPRSPEEQLQQKVEALDSVLESLGVDDETRKAAITQAITGQRRLTLPRPPAPRAEGWEVIEQNGVITGVRTRDKAGPSFLRDDDAMPEEAREFLDAAVSARKESLEADVERDARRTALAIEKAVVLSGLREEVANRKIGHKLADSARDSDKLVGKMDSILRDIKAAGGVITGPQTMALLSFHMSMTIGDLKGGRASWPIIEKHLRSRSWPETFVTLVKGIRARQGEAGLISIGQAREWVELARMRRGLDWIQALEGIRARNMDINDFGIPADILGNLGTAGLPPPPDTPGQPKTAEEYNRLRGQQ